MRIGIAILSLLLIVSGVVWGYQCGPQPACAVVYPGSVVFVGKFLDPGVEWSMGSERPARLVVVEHFAGLDAGEDEVRIEGILPWIDPTGLWLISAVRKKDNPALQIDICGNTGPLADHQEELDYLRRRGRGETATRIFGSVRAFFDPLDGVEVVATAPGGHEYRTTSNSRADYDLAHVAPGEYSMRLELSNSQRQYYRPVTPYRWAEVDLPGDRAEVNVARGSCVSSDFVLDHDGEVSGRLIGDDDGPAEGVEVNLVQTEDDKLRDRDQTVVSGVEGIFRFLGVNPGRYRLGVNIRAYVQTGPYPPTYYSGESNQLEAQVVEVNRAEKVGGLEIRLPPRRAERIILVTVVDSDGNPVEGASIADAPTGSGRVRDYNSLRAAQTTDASGRVTLVAASGVRYALFAAKQTDHSDLSLLASRAVVIPPGKQTSTIRLVMDLDLDLEMVDIHCEDEILLDDSSAVSTATCDKLPIEQPE